jgi:chloride channel protein, CIC family
MEAAKPADHRRNQRLLPVVNARGRLVGVLTRGDIHRRVEQEGESVLGRLLGDLARPEPVEAFPDEPLRVVVYRMAEKGVTRLPVVEPGNRKFLGLISLDDLLKARARHLEEERRREQVLSLKFFLPGGGVQNEASTSAAP